MRFKTLADVYAAILKGEIDIEEAFVMVDGGDFMVYEGGAKIFECSYDEAMEFVSDIMGLTYKYP